MNTMTETTVKTFAALSRIPHGSGSESALRAALETRLTALGGQCDTDKAGNLRCDLPATPGREGENTLCFQGHLDMVCAHIPGFDPVTEGVTCVVEGDTLRSDRRSSLGADNLLAVAALLTLLASGVSHGKLRLLLTVREEVGLQGAQAVSPRWLDGVDALVNLDGFSARRCIVGSAGGVREQWGRPVALVPNRKPGWRVTLSGYPGGHSGSDIAMAGENPIRVLATVLARADVEIDEISGGGALNEIPTGVSAVVAAESPERLQAALEALVPPERYTLEPAASPVRVLRDWDRQALLDFLLALPIGVLNWRSDFPTIPAASTNLASVRWDGEAVTVGLFHRASPAVVLERTERGAGLHAQRCGFTRLTRTAYTPWEGTAEGFLPQAVNRIWRELTGSDMELTAVHVGLEPAALLGEHPNLPAVSIGTDIRNAHSVHEEASLSGLAQLLNLLTGLLQPGAVFPENAE